MFVVLGLVPLFIVIAVVWPIVAIVKQQEEWSGYTFTACMASWYAQIMRLFIEAPGMAQQALVQAMTNQ